MCRIIIPSFLAIAVGYGWKTAGGYSIAGRSWVVPYHRSSEIANGRLDTWPHRRIYPPGFVKLVKSRIWNWPRLFFTVVTGKLAALRSL
jgi:hypothetical protein